MRAAEGILTARGGMTSHAALVARGWGKCCIVGCGALHVDVVGEEDHAGDKILRRGRLDYAERHQRPGLRRAAAHDGRHGRTRASTDS